MVRSPYAETDARKPIVPVHDDRRRERLPRGNCRCRAPLRAAEAYRGRSAQRNRSHHGQWIGTAAPSNLGYSLRLLRPSPVAARRDVVGALHAWQAPDDRHAASGNGIGGDNRLRQDGHPLSQRGSGQGINLARFGQPSLFKSPGRRFGSRANILRAAFRCQESEISVSSCRASIRAAPMDISAIGSPSAGISAIRHCPLGLRRRETWMFCARSPRPAVVAIVMSVRGIAPLHGSSSRSVVVELIR